MLPGKARKLRKPIRSGRFTGQRRGAISEKRFNPLYNAFCCRFFHCLVSWPVSESHPPSSSRPSNVLLTRRIFGRWCACEWTSCYRNNLSLLCLSARLRAPRHSLVARPEWLGSRDTFSMLLKSLRLSVSAGSFLFFFCFSDRNRRAFISLRRFTISTKGKNLRFPPSVAAKVASGAQLLEIRIG